MRICAVVSCHNSDYHLKKWKTGGCQGGQPFILHRFPPEKSSERYEWAKLINRINPMTGKMWLPTKNDYVCSMHFPNGIKASKNARPTENLGYTKLSGSSKRKSPTKRKLPPKKKRKLVFDSDMTPQECIEHDHTYSFKCDCSDKCSCVGCANYLKSYVKSLEYENSRLRDLVASHEVHDNTKAVTFETKALRSDKSVRFYTGLNSLAQFHQLYEFLEKKSVSMAYWQGKKHASKKPASTQRANSRKLSQKQELLVTLIKLKLDLKLNVLADLFDVSQTLITKVFNTWIKFLAKELRPLIFWPSRKMVRRLMPKSLARLKNLICTIDCTETFVDRPRDREIYCLTFSDYKKHTTVKYLVAIAPNGMISYISPVWGGKASDRKITLADGILDNLKPGDLVLADRGFTINDVLVQRQVSIDIPPASSGVTQMTKQNVLKTKRIASKRIHVERAIGRLKHFTILKQTLPVTFMPLVDDIVVVCAALCNLLPPLVT